MIRCTPATRAIRALPWTWTCNCPGAASRRCIGHSGSGKTTCLRCIAGLERADQGFIQVNDEVWQDSRKEDLRTAA